MDLIEAYIEYNEQTEPPAIYHRWSITVGIAALLGRKVYIPFGHTRIYPNLYTMLIGDVGTRKTTAINIAVDLLTKAGYNSFAARKTSKEKFLMDLQGIDENGKSFISDSSDISDLGGVWDEGDKTIRETLIAADEFNEFTTGDKLDFYSMLGDIWDWNKPHMFYTSRIKNSKTGGVAIYQPTINIIAGNTPESFARAFPPEATGQGFMSRLLLIYGEPSQKKFHIPPSPDIEMQNTLVTFYEAILQRAEGPIEFEPDIIAAGGMVDKIYRDYEGVDDIKFKNYSTRRYTQFLKLCIIYAVANRRTIIDEEIVIKANTVLAAAERNMPRAIGEFGKNQSSDISQRVLDIVRKATRPISFKDIFRQVRNDVKKIEELRDIVNNLMSGEVIQFIRAGSLEGYLPLIKRKGDSKYVDWNVLTCEEKELVGL